MKWNGREAIEVANSAMKVVVLPGGGHIASVRLHIGDTWSENLLWEAPWPTTDPGSPTHKELVQRYGGAPNGPFFATWTGHALCCDLFGSPSTTDEEAGIPLHGEAAARVWQFVTEEDRFANGSVCLTGAGLHVERSLRIVEEESVLRCSERVENRGKEPRSVHWVQHVTVGTAILPPNSGSIAASVQKGKIWPLGYEGRELLRSDASFEWPHAPGSDGSEYDLRIPFQKDKTGFVASLEQLPGERFAWVTAFKPECGLCVGYCFMREDFPWLAIWEENCARDYAPWNGTTRARGLEFGTTPMPLERSATTEMGERESISVARNISAGEIAEARWVMFVVRLPKDSIRVQKVRVDKDALTVMTEAGQQVEVRAKGIRSFLSREAVL